MQPTTLSRYHDVGLLLLRLAFGFQLVKASWPYATSFEKLQEFKGYLTSLGFPLPEVGIYVSTYAEFLGGFLLILGLFTRWVSAVVAFNFLLAVLFAHLAVGDSYPNTMPALNLMVVNVVLLLNGPGKFSIDARLGRT